MEKGITGGISATDLFGPNDPCTRAQIVTFLWRAAGSPAPKNTGTAFARCVTRARLLCAGRGVGRGEWHHRRHRRRYVQPRRYLHPCAERDLPVSCRRQPRGQRQSRVQRMWRPRPIYADAVAWAAKKGITSGIGGGLFGSGNDCTRAQIVTFLYRSVK